MSAGDYATGMLFFLPTYAAALGAAYLVLRRRYGYLQSLHRALAFMVLATAAIVFAHVLPAMLGVLDRWSALLTAALLLLVVWFVSPTEAARPGVADPQSPPSSRPSLLVALAAVGIVVVAELARLRGLTTHPITSIDMLGFHLPGIARFIQTGSLWRVDQFEPGFATAQYPNNGDFLILSVVLPWRDLAFARFATVPFYALTGVATYALALELRATRAAAATMAAAVIAVPALSRLALDGLPDTVSLATLGAGLVFLLRYERGRRTGELLLAGLAFGLSAGTKWYGLTAIIVVLAVWGAARLLARGTPARLARDGGALLGMILVGGGFWLLRNVVESGNPIYPKQISLLGARLFAGSKDDVIDRYGYTIAGYLGKPHILKTYVWPGFKLEVGLTGLVLALGLIIAASAGIRSLRRGGTYAVATAIVTLGMCAMYVITPGSAYGTKDFPVEGHVNIRWLVPAIMVAAALTARAVVALWRAGLLLELAGLAGVLDGIRRVAGTPASSVAETVLELVVIVAVVVLATRWIARHPEWRLWTRRSILAAAGALVAGVFATGYLAERGFDRLGYAGYDATFAWIDAHAPAHHRIGITGIYSSHGLAPTLPSFGPRFGNVVAYVGDPVRHSLHVPAHRTTFEAELREGRYDLLLIGLRDTAHTDSWARAVGYREVARSDRLALYQAR